MVAFCLQCNILTFAFGLINVYIE